MCYAQARAFVCKYCMSSHGLDRKTSEIFITIFVTLPRGERKHETEERWAGIQTRNYGVLYLVPRIYIFIPGILFKIKAHITAVTSHKFIFEIPLDLFFSAYLIFYRTSCLFTYCLANSNNPAQLEFAARHSHSTRSVWCLLVEEDTKEGQSETCVCEERLKINEWEDKSG